MVTIQDAGPMKPILKMKMLDERAIAPTQGHPGEDAAYDMYAIDDGKFKFVNGKLLYIEYNTGWAIEPPHGYHTEIMPRSSNSKKDLLLCNSVGLVDGGYRGDILFRYQLIDSLGNMDDKYLTDADYSWMKSKYDLYKKGDRVGQIIMRLTHHFNIEVVSELEDSQRGEAGLGSTGN